MDRVPRARQPRTTWRRWWTWLRSRMSSGALRPRLRRQERDFIQQFCQLGLLGVRGQRFHFAAACKSCRGCLPRRTQSGLALGLCEPRLPVKSRRCCAIRGQGAAFSSRAGEKLVPLGTLAARRRPVHRWLSPRAASFVEQHSTENPQQQRQLRAVGLSPRRRHTLWGLTGARSAK